MKPLQGIRVLDFTWVLSGPFATRLLADFGAEVIKIQQPGKMSADVNNDPYTCTWNRNKRSIALDMNDPEAKHTFFEMVKTSDVVVDNFSPHVLERWGIDYESLRAVNPRIIQAQISAAGHSGEGRGISGFGPGIQAMTGLTAATSYEDGEPQGIGFAYADHVMGLTASMRILEALLEREETGEGAYIDISGIAAVEAVVDDKVPEFAQAVACADGWCAVSPEAPMEIGSASCSAAELAQRLQSEGVAAYPVLGGQALLADEQLAARGFINEIEHPVIGTMLVDRCPIHTIPDEPLEARPSPQLGEATWDRETGILSSGE